MKYYIKRKNKVQGPFSKEELKARTLLPTALVRTENSEEWVRADHCKELEETVVPMPNTWWLISLITVFVCPSALWDCSGRTAFKTFITKGK